MNFKFKIRTAMVIPPICSGINSQKVHTRIKAGKLLVPTYNYLEANCLLQACKTINKSSAMALKYNYRKQETHSHNNFPYLYTRIQPTIKTSPNYLKKLLTIHKKIGLTERVYGLNGNKQIFIQKGLFENYTTHILIHI